MELYLFQVPDDMKLEVRFVEEDDYTWYTVMKSSKGIDSSGDLKTLLVQRFFPINKENMARKKLNNCVQTTSVEEHNEKFIRIITDIPKICSDETVDRYMCGIEIFIRTELCAKEYEQIDQIISDYIKVEA